MRLLHRAPLLLVALLVLAAACDDSGGGDARPTPAVLDRIVFGAETPQGEHALYLVAPDGSALERLSTETGAIFFPRVSPPGDRVAYVVAGASNEAPAFLRVYDLTTRSATTLSNKALANADARSFDWSPDGERIVFSDSAGRLRIVEVATGDPVDFPGIEGAWPAWSPDGETIAFVTTMGNVAVVEPDGNGQRTVYQTSGPAKGIAWAPEGERLAFETASEDDPPALSVLVIDLEGAEVATLEGASDPAWSPNGDRIAYSAPTASGAANREIFVATVGEEDNALTETVTIERHPAWSPSGDAVAYVAEADPETAFLCLAGLEPPERNCLDLRGVFPGAPHWR